MRAPLSSLIRVLREIAYGIDSMHALMHGSQPAVPPYPPPSLFNVPVTSGGPGPRQPGAGLGC